MNYLNMNSNSMSKGKYNNNNNNDIYYNYGLGNINVLGKYDGPKIYKANPTFMSSLLIL